MLSNARYFAAMTAVALAVVTQAAAADPRVVKVVAGPVQSCALVDDGRLFCWQVAHTDMQLGLDAKPVDGLPRLKDFDIGTQDLSCGIDAEGATICWQPFFEDVAGAYRPTHTFRPKTEPRQSFTRVAVGFAHVCALDESGALWCVGNNPNGELGTGDTESHGDMRKVVGLSSVVAFDTGINNTCAVTRQGEAWCWGTDSPVANHPMIVNSIVPAQVSGPQSLVAVQDGRNSMCATSSEPAVYCWGDNIMAQLGVPNSEMHGRRSAVIKQALEQPAVAISSGMYSTCIVVQDGTVRCWGLSIGSMKTVYTPEPKRLPLPASSVSVSTGDDKACALLNDGGVWCWGGKPGVGAKVGDEAIYTEEPWQVVLPLQ